MTYGEGSTHFWRHQIQNWLKFFTMMDTIDERVLADFVKFSVAHLEYSIIEDEYRSACQRTSEAWPEDFLSRLPEAQSKVDKAASIFVEKCELLRSKERE